MRITSVLLWAVLSPPLSALGQTPDNDINLARGAVGDALEIVAAAEPDVPMPRVELALLTGILGGPQALPEIDALATHAVRWGRPGDILTLLRGSTLTDLPALVSGEPEFGGLPATLSGVVLKRWGSDYIDAMETRQWGQVLEAARVLQEPDLVPHMAALLGAVRLSDQELAVGVARLARGHFSQLPPAAELARDYSFILQLREWIGEEEYRAGLAALVEGLAESTLYPDPLVLTTEQGTAELSPAEFFSFELIRRALLNERYSGLEHLPALADKVASVGGWESVNSWYRRDRAVHRDASVAETASTRVTQEEINLAVARIQAIEPKILMAPLTAEHEIRLLAVGSGLSDLMMLTTPASPLTEEARSELMTIVRTAVTGMQGGGRPRQMAALREWSGEPDPDSEDESSVRAWLRELDARPRKTMDRPSFLAAAEPVIRDLARTDLAAALRIARGREDPQQRLHFILWAVEDTVVNWRRPDR